LDRSIQPIELGTGHGIGLVKRVKKPMKIGQEQEKLGTGPFFDSLTIPDFKSMQKLTINVRMNVIDVTSTR